MLAPVRGDFEDFITYPDKFIIHLQAIKIIGELNDSQLEGFCKLMNTNLESQK